MSALLLRFKVNIPLLATLMYDLCHLYTRTPHLICLFLLVGYMFFQNAVMLIPSPLLCLEGESVSEEILFPSKKFKRNSNLVILTLLCKTLLPCASVWILYPLQQLETGKGPHRRSRQFFLCIFLCIGCAKSSCSGKVPTTEAAAIFSLQNCATQFTACVCFYVVSCSLMTFLCMCLYLFCACLYVCLPICVWCCRRVQLDDLL